MVLVIGAGFGRTGTVSTKTALERLFQLKRRQEGSDNAGETQEGHAAVGVGESSSSDHVSVSEPKCYHFFEIVKSHGHMALWKAHYLEGKPLPYKLMLDGGGFQGTMDFPICLKYQELLAIYPDAKVLLTVRDEARWDASWSRVETLVWIMDRIVGVLVPPVRWHVLVWLVPLLWGKDTGIFQHELGAGGSSVEAYRKHVAEVRRTVPAHRLVEYNVKEGWAPLCAMLDVDVPDEPFPFANAGMSGIWRQFVEQLWKQYRLQVIAVGVLLFAAIASVWS